MLALPVGNDFQKKTGAPSSAPMKKKQKQKQQHNLLWKKPCAFMFLSLRERGPPRATLAGRRARSPPAPGTARPAAPTCTASLEPREMLSAPARSQPLSRGHSRTPRGRRAGPTRGRGGPRRLPRSLPSRDPRGPSRRAPGNKARAAAPPSGPPGLPHPPGRSRPLRPPRGDPSPPKRELPRVPPRLFGRRSVHEASGPPATGAPAPPSVSLPLPTSGSEAPSRGPLARPRQRPA